MARIRPSKPGRRLMLQRGDRPSRSRTGEQVNVLAPTARSPVCCRAGLAASPALSGTVKEAAACGDQRAISGSSCWRRACKRGDLRRRAPDHRNPRRRWPRTSRGAGCPTAPRAHAADIPGTPSSRRGPRPRTRAVLELPAEFGAHDVRLHRGVGPGLAKHLDARPALLLAQIGLVRRPVDVEDHGLLLLPGPGPAGAPVSCRLVVVAIWPMRSFPGCQRGD